MNCESRQINMRSDKTLKKQQGAVVILLAVGMTALLAVAGLAIDTGNLFLNKSKLQNAADVAALSAAAALNAVGGDYLKAKTSALARFQDVLATPGNEKLRDAFNSNDISVTVSTSPTLSPFVGSNAAGDWYVRVNISALQLDSFFLSVIGIDTLDVPASAVAGRTPVGVSGGGEDLNPICGIAPMMVCGDPSQPPGTESDNFWGYTPGDAEILKASSKDGTVIGPGNFQLVRLSDENGEAQAGGSEVRDAMAGSNNSCLNAVQGNKIPTEPGNTVGPAVQGVNTRFGLYSGPLKGSAAEYPGDYVSGFPRGEALDYDTYQEYYDDGVETTGCVGCYSEGEAFRRIVAIPIGDCSEQTNGQGDVPLLDMGCFFITQKALQKGNEASIYGQFVEDCPVSVTPPPGEGPETNEENAANPGGAINQGYIIQLYKNPGSRDS